MKTIVLTTDPTPNLNMTSVHIDSSSFDPHIGPTFWITFYNPSGIVIDRKTQNLSIEDWQNWGSEEDEISDYLYLAAKVSEAAGFSFNEMTSPCAPAPVPDLDAGQTEGP